MRFQFSLLTAFALMLVAAVLLLIHLKCQISIGLMIDSAIVFVVGVPIVARFRMKDENEHAIRNGCIAVAGSLILAAAYFVGTKSFLYLVRQLFN